MGLPKKKPGDVTTLLRDYRAGDPHALDALLPLVYEQLKRIAANQLKAQVRHHTLSSTALVHEAYVKMLSNGEMTAQDKSHFYAIAAQAMRWVLVDYARAKKRDKRGGEQVRVTFVEGEQAAPETAVDSGELGRLLSKLEKRDPRLCRVVELMQLVGLTHEETAEALGVSVRTVKRDWVLAKHWLARELGEDSKK